MCELAGMPARAALRAVAKALAGAGVPDAAFDARELCRFVTGRDPRLDDTPLTADIAARLAGLAARRAAREPLQYLLGSWDFLDFTLAVGPGVLCPRADSEVVCEAALDCLRADGKPDPVVYDLCAGSGCLGLGIKRFWGGARVTCVENSPEALRYLRRNAVEALGGAAVEVLQADVLADAKKASPESLDGIIANPPYLTGEEMAALMPETAHEPAAALDGGPDGLRFYRCLLTDWQRPLRPGGWLVLEIGCDQAADVCRLAQAAGWQQIAVRRDYGGNDRAVTLRKAGKTVEKSGL